MLIRTISDVEQGVEETRNKEGKGKTNEEDRVFGVLIAGLEKLRKWEDLQTRYKQYITSNRDKRAK